MTVLLQLGRCHGLLPAEDTVSGGGKHGYAVNRGGEPADGRCPEPVAEKSADRGSNELAET